MVGRSLIIAAIPFPGILKMNPYEEADQQVIAASANSNDVKRNQYELFDRIGVRFAGTQGYRDAADFMADRMKSYGLDDAELEPFEFTAWRRGTNTGLEVVEPFELRIDCLALPYAATTDTAGLATELLVIGEGGEDSINAYADRIRGRLVLIVKPARHRHAVYAQLAELGAAGMIMNSNFPGTILRTGSIDNGIPGKMPAVAIAMESALWLARVNEHHAITLTLTADGICEPDTTWNVVAHLKGTEPTDEFIIVGGHLDSHDVAPGAYDNGAGALMVMEIARLLAGARQHVKRTIRFIGFAGEEVGLLGSQYHAKANEQNLKNARAMINLDMPGLVPPWTFVGHHCPGVKKRIAEIADQTSLELDFRRMNHTHSDHHPFNKLGIGAIGLTGGPVEGNPGRFAHTAGDTSDKLPSDLLREASAVAARVALRAASDDDWPGFELDGPWQR